MSIRPTVTELWYAPQMGWTVGKGPLPSPRCADLFLCTIAFARKHGINLRSFHARFNFNLENRALFIAGGLTLTLKAAAVNYHRIQEAVELFSDIWMEDLKKRPLPTSYTSEVLPWLFIFWVFRKKDGFRNMTRILHQESDDNLEDEANAVPTIPASIISKFTVLILCGQT